MKRLVICSMALMTLFSCSEDKKEPEALTAEEEAFITEYEYVTFNFSPTSFGGLVNEKWIGDIPIFLDGAITEAYIERINQELQLLNDHMTDGSMLRLVNSVEASKIHLFLGNEDEIAGLWPDMYTLVSGGQFQGYALYNAGAGQILQGRIWVKNSGRPIFRHELGHILGFGHASDDYCNNSGSQERSYMCSSLAEDYSNFDAAMIQMLYHPEVLPGLTFEALRPTVEALLRSGEIQL